MDTKVLGLNIKVVRYKTGMSQAQLAEMINMSNNSIASIEMRRQIPSAINLYLIAKALGVTIDELFKGIE